MRGRDVTSDQSEDDVSARLVDTGEGPAGEGGHKLARHHQGVVTHGEAAAHVDLGHQGVSTSHADAEHHLPEPPQRCTQGPQCWPVLKILH